MRKLRIVLLLIAVSLVLSACGYSVVEEMPVQVGKPASDSIQLP